MSRGSVSTEPRYSSPVSQYLCRQGGILSSRSCGCLPLRQLGAAVLLATLGLTLLRPIPVHSGSSTPQQVAQATPAGGQTGTDFTQGDFWALIVGINEYPRLSPQRQLKAARPGAEAVARILRQYGVERERIVSLYDRNAGRQAILAQLQGPLRRDVGPNDSVFIYFAGHCRVDPQTKEVEWLPADAVESTPASFLSVLELQILLAQIPARHVFMVADSCVDEGLLGTSRILGAPTVLGVYQRKSRWVLAAGTSAPQADGDGPSPFTQAFVGSLRDNQLAYLTPIHLGQEVAKRLPPAALQTLKDGPMAGLGDDDGQFVFRLDGATPPTSPVQVPAPEDPSIARLTQYIEIAKSVNLPQTLKDQILADLQGQMETVNRAIGEQRRKQEAARTQQIEAWRRRSGR
jgi:hypothetical protein